MKFKLKSGKKVKLVDDYETLTKAELLEIIELCEKGLKKLSNHIPNIKGL